MKTYTIIQLSEGGPQSLVATLKDEKGKAYPLITLWKDNWLDLQEGKKVDGTINHLTLRPARSVGYAYTK